MGGSPGAACRAVVERDLLIAADWLTDSNWKGEALLALGRTYRQLLTDDAKAIAAFRRVDDNTLVVARTLGATPFGAFRRVALPLAAPGLAAGAAMSWARSLGEFGATLLFAGNLTGRTQTLPLAVYTAMESDLRGAQALSLVMVALALLVLLVVRRVQRA